jgi:glycosyltransferase involved in cell wall biosynthesis
MRCPTLYDLPAPPPGKLGWPWTEASAELPEAMADGQDWPRVSIVTPSYQQGPFIEETIRSVLLQGYPNLEYIVIDGGSTDETVAILRKYEKWIAYWVSEPDKGQSDAINKGFAKARGDLFGWLNSDDVYERCAIPIIAKYFTKDGGCSLVYGNGWYVDEQGKKTRPCHWIKPYNRRLFFTTNFVLQPAAFWRREIWERTGGLDSDLHWAMDWEWLLRATALTQPHYLRLDLARWRFRSGIKTVSGGWARRAEIAEISKKYGGVRQPTYLLYRLDRLISSMERGQLGKRSADQMIGYLLAPMSWILKMTLWRGRHLT